MAFDFSAASFEEAIAALWADAAAALYRLAPRRRTRRTAPTIRPCSRARRARWRRRPPGLHFTAELDARRSRQRGVSRHFLTLHVGPGTFLPVRSADTAGHVMHAETGAITAETAEALNAVKARGGKIVAVGTTSLRLLESATGDDGRACAVLRRHQSLHHAGLPLPLRRPADDQFPSAALDAVHAGLGIFGSRCYEAGLRACGRGALPLLFLWRCLSVEPMQRDVKTELCLHPQSARRRSAAWRDRDPARAHPHACLHAGRHRGDGEGDAAGDGEVDRRRHHPRQHLSSDAAARRRAHRPARRPAPLHALGRPDPHRFRRLSGDVARQAAQDRRGRRHLPVAYRRRHRAA